MRRYFTIWLVFNSVCVATVAASQAVADGKADATGSGGFPIRTIHWLDREAAVIDAVRRTNRPILVYVTSSHCGFCRKMERDTWSAPAVVAAVNSGFIPLYISADVESEFTRQLHVRAYPTTIAFSPQGKRLSTTEGYLPPRRMQGMLESIRRRGSEGNVSNTPHGDDQVTTDSPAQP